LDFTAKPIFSIALIYGHWAIKPERLGLKIELFTEKDPAAMQTGNNIAVNGHEHAA
jgi:hypothetical protein